MCSTLLVTKNALTFKKHTEQTNTKEYKYFFLSLGEYENTIEILLSRDIRT